MAEWRLVLVNDDGDLPLPMLAAGKNALYSCSSDPELEDARGCFRAMLAAAPDPAQDAALVEMLARVLCRQMTGANPDSQCPRNLAALWTEYADDARAVINVLYGRGEHEAG